MSVRCRPMKARDVSQSVGILASHAIVAPRYGEAINQLGPAWLRVLDCDAFRTIVFEEVEGDAVPGGKGWVWCGIGGDQKNYALLPARTGTIPISQIPGATGEVLPAGTSGGGGPGTP